MLTDDQLSPTPQRVSPQELRELADGVDKLYELDLLAEKLRQLADQLERDEDLEKKRNAQQRISSQRVLEIAEYQPALVRLDLLQLADQMERDAKVIVAARVVDELSGGTCWKKLRQALADLDRRED